MKNIVIFSDGTGQEGGVRNNTNVYDLFNMIEDRTQRQVSFYDRGLGTGWRKISGSIGGGGISKNIQECYEFISNCYSAGDNLYLFGFSRGATTVRTLSAFIELFGILPRSRPELIKLAYDIYRIGNAERKRKKAVEFLRLNHTMWCRIKFLGVWDTVAALGVPIKGLDVIVDKIPFLKHSYHNLRLSKSVEFARHALAIDDERLTFHPVLWDESEEGLQENGGSEPASLRISADDITDLYLLATKLKSAADPVSTALLKGPMGNALREIIEGFDEGDRLTTASSEHIKTELAGELDKAIEGDSLYKRDNPEFAGMQWSSETEEQIKKKDAATDRHLIAWEGTTNERDEATNRLLNRLLLEDTYALRPAIVPRLKQAWFAGMHTDVGGGYAENELARIPLMWMVKEAIDVGLLIYEKHNVDLRMDASGLMHNSREKLGRLYRKGARFWDVNKNQGKPPLVHESVLIRSHECAYKPWILRMKHEVEPWPKRLMSSVQFDDHHIWREGFWGWGSAFSVPWSSVSRISLDEPPGAITLELHGEEDPIVIRGSLSTEIRHLSNTFERRKLSERIERDNALQERLDARQKREDARLAHEDERLKAEDERLNRIVKKHDRSLEQLEKRIQEQILELEKHDQKLREQDENFQKKDKTLMETVDGLKMEIKRLKGERVVKRSRSGGNDKTADGDLRSSPLS
jgi:uncharacterized protein (DUF2235 family)